MMASVPWITVDQAARLARAAPGRVWLAGSAAMPGAVLDAVDAAPRLWAGLTLTGAFIPGINDAARPRARRSKASSARRALQGHPGWRPLPLHYSACWRRLSQPGLVSHA